MFQLRGIAFGYEEQEGRTLRSAKVAMPAFQWGSGSSLLRFGLGMVLSCPQAKGKCSGTCCGVLTVISQIQFFLNIPTDHFFSVISRE